MAVKFTSPQRPLTWLITGCSSGLGLALARLVQAKGHRVIASSRNPPRTPELVAEIEGKGGKWIQLDVEDRESKKVMEDLEASGEQIDVLVNNAGYSIHTCVEAFADEELQSLMQIHYFGPMRLITSIVPGMRKRRFGVVVNVSSGAGLEARCSMGGYGAAKAAMDNMTKTLAREVAEFNVRAFFVSAGGFKTGMSDRLTLGKNPIPKDYDNSEFDKLFQVLMSGRYVPDGDSQKAVQAIYDVTMGEGAGAGHEAERCLPLGRDAAIRVKEVYDFYGHALEAFGELANNVYRDDKA